jgi:predicted AlkP superfamily phosphohydrolase/phosphomutase
MTAAATPPLVIVGIDAGDPHLILRWTRDGHLPAMASIIQRGCWGMIGGPEMVSTQGTWLSLFSGVSRAEHGYYYHRQLRPRTYGLEPVTARDAHALPFWAQMRGGPRTVAIIDALETYPLAGVVGVQLADWAVQQEYDAADLPVSSEPPGLLSDVLRLAGDPIQVDVFAPATDPRQDLDAYHLLLKRVAQKGQLCRQLLGRDCYDLAVMTFVECHTAAHRFWDYRSDAPRRGAGVDESPALRNAIQTVYQAVDRELGLLLEQLPPKANILIVSLCGMKDLYPTAALAEAFCRQLGYQVRSATARVALNPLSHARRIMPPRWRAAISRWLPRQLRERLSAADGSLAGTDWARTTAFPLPSLNTSFIRVNLRGREPQGIVNPGAEYGRLLDRIEADLAMLVDVRTGAPAVEKVTRTVAAFHTAPLLALPDLFVEWRAASHFMNRVAHPTGDLVQARPLYDRSSYHSFIGFMGAAGPSISARGPIGEASLLDLAPTCLALLGEPVPPALTGTVIQRMLPGTLPDARS